MKNIKEDYTKKIELFKKKGDNMKCFECNQKGTTYICTTFGTFVCADCAGVLSHLISKIFDKYISYILFLSIKL